MIHHISAEYLTVDRVREILENNIKIDLSEDAKKTHRALSRIPG